MKATYTTIAPNSPPSFSVQPAGRKIAITWTFTVSYLKEDNGAFSCYIKGWDIYFSAKNREDVDRKSRAIMEMYMDHFIIHKKRGLNSLLLMLHKKGFRAKKDAYVLGQLLNNKAVAAQFKMVEERIDPNFAGASTIDHEVNTMVEAEA